MKWWEKTVEYFFIQNYVKNLFIAPLDGNEELAGDALLSKNQKWVIIEFKDKESSLDSEKKKFKSYDEALKELGKNDHHHCLIYGKIGDGKFKLGGQTYFSRNGIGSIEKFLDNGIDEVSFIEYLGKLLKYKSEKGTTASGNVGSYSLVAGISNTNKIISCMTLHEYGLEHDLTFEATPKHEKQMEIERDRGLDYGGPSF